MKRILLALSLGFAFGAHADLDNTQTFDSSGKNSASARRVRLRIVSCPQSIHVPTSVKIHTYSSAA